MNGLLVLARDMIRGKRGDGHSSRLEGLHSLKGHDIDKRHLLLGQSEIFERALLAIEIELSAARICVAKAGLLAEMIVVAVSEEDIGHTCGIDSALYEKIIGMDRHVELNASVHQHRGAASRALGDLIFLQSFTFCRACSEK